MFKKSITFENFNGDTVTKDFYFHISKAEFLEMAAGGDQMKQRIDRIIAAKDGRAILDELRALIRMSVGMRSEDGQFFLKTAQAQSYLFDSPAFDELLMELATDTDASVQFVNQLIPEKMQKEMQQRMSNQKDTRPDGSVPHPFGEKPDNRPAYQREHRHPTDAEMAEMSQQELREALSWRGLHGGQ
jgi:hypothetical protein